MGLSLRPVTPNDELFLYQLVHDHMAETLYVSAWDPKLREPLLKMQIEGQRSSYAAQFPRADYGIIVYDDEAIGRLIMDRTPECHYLVDIMIAKQYRGKGIGTWLMRALCTEAEMMSKPLRLQVFVNNRAKGLYERLGFRTLEANEVTWLMERAPGTISQVSLAHP
jgi:ribosomal protein S18 acetylase RimI-like enzyme